MRVRRRCPPVKADKLRALSGLQTLLERARRIRIQQRHDKHKLYALHAAQVQCISKGKARNPYALGCNIRWLLRAISAWPQFLGKHRRLVSHLVSTLT